MDEGAFLVASTGSIELSQFFDGMIDIGNPPQNGQNEPTVKPSRPVAADSGPGRPPKSSMQPKSNVEPKAGEEVENGTVTMKPPVDQQAKSKYLEEVAARIEAAKKNLREKRDGGAEKRNARAAILIFYNYQLVINIVFNGVRSLIFILIVKCWPENTKVAAVRKLFDFLTYLWAIHILIIITNYAISN
ncbi:uncharacterized protein [Arachis hypogaea]|uniref:uncharacterized protein n=1 Tax=Arachis hypogaea TaxID=3818 RepID=UPI003B2130FD